MPYDFSSLGEPNNKTNEQKYDFSSLGGHAEVQASVNVSSFFKPDEEAQKQKLAKDLKKFLGEDWAPAAVDPAEAQRRLRVVENDHVLRNSPRLAQNFLNPEFARIAQDDVGTLGKIEKLWGDRTLAGTVGDIGVTALKGAVGLPQAFVGLADIFTGGYAGKGLEAAGFKFNETQKILGSLYSDPQQRANAAVRGAEGIGETLLTALQYPSTIATTVGESIPQMLGGAAIGRSLLAAGGRAIGAGMAGPTLPGWLARAFGEKWAPILAGAAGEGILGAGSAAEQIRGETDDGLLTAKQSLSALGSGVGTALFSVAGGAAAKKLGIADLDTALVRGGLDEATADTLKKGFVRKIAEAGVSEGLFEEMPQSAQEQMWQNFALDRPLLDGVGNAAAMGLLAGLATGGAVEGYNGFVQRIGNQAARDQEAQRINQLATALAEFSTYAEASMLRQRSAEDAQSYFQSLTEDGLNAVYITPEALAQSGMAEAIAQAIPEVRTQLESAVQTGHDIRLPIADLMAALPGEQLNQSILPNVSETPGGFTMTTAQEYMQSGRAQELERIVSETLGAQEADSAVEASKQTVKEAVLANLNQVGRNTQQVNESYATLISSYAATRAQQMGITPEEFFTKRMLRVAGQGMAGDQYDQGGMGSFDVDRTWRDLIGRNKFSDFDEDAEFTATSNDGDLAPGLQRVPREFTLSKQDGSKWAALNVRETTLDSGEIAFTSSLEVGADGFDKGTGIATRMYLSALNVAKQRGIGWISEGVRSDNALAIYNRLKKAGVPFVEVGNASYISAEDLAKVDLQAVADKMAPQRLNQSAYTAETVTVDGVERTVFNSNGKRIAQTEEGLRNFWRWFGSSPMVDEQGRPVVVYHGSKTPQELKNFVPGGVEGSQRSGDAYGVGAYFTTSQNEASAPVYVGENGAVFPVYVTGNLLNMDAPTPEQLQMLTEFARESLLPSDKARFDTGRERREFDNAQDAKEFFDAQRENYKAFGDGMARNQPKARDENGKFIVEFTNFDADIAIKTPSDVTALVSAVGYDSLVSMFDGIVMNKAGGRKWAVMYRPDGNIKSATGNRGTFDPNDANILHQSSIDQTESQSFKEWAGTDRPVIDSDDINDFDFSQQGPFVMRGYHGTTNEFSVFDASVKGNVEGQFGAVNYFTSSEQDASGNYAGEGPDLTNRIEQKAEPLADEIQDLYDEVESEEGEEAAVEAVKERYGEEFYSEDTLEMARNIVRKELHGGDEIVMEVFIRTEKPFVVGDTNSPWIEFFDESALEEQAIAQVADNNGVSVEDVKADFDTYTDEIDDARYQIMDEQENPVVQAVQTVADRYDFDPSDLLAELYDMASDGSVRHNRLEEFMRQSESLAYAERPDDGAMIQSQMIGEIIQELGYDSIILKNANVRFKGMNMERGTAHIHVFDADNTNIKSATDNSGAFDRNDPNIYRQGEANRASVSFGNFEVFDAAGKSLGYQQADNPQQALGRAKASGRFSGAASVGDKPISLVQLLANADLSSFLHESGHYFFETDIAIAGELAQEARVFGMDSLKPGEQQILKDVSTLLSWHGIQGGIEDQLAQWANMDFEERRSYHERTAESFEKYLFEGKAPSIELQSYFQKFATWMKSVYQSIKQFLAQNPEAGKLNAEVRAVFDRMLATDEQIKIAEQARSMMPLFLAPEQAGWTADQFSEYQRMGEGATQQAISELQAKGLQDLAWADRLRLKALREKKREAAEARSQLEGEARREILSQQVYRAWTFLTAKMTTDDMTPEQRADEQYRNDIAAWRAARRGIEETARRDVETIEWNSSEEGQKKYRKLSTMEKVRKSFLSAMSDKVDKIVADKLAAWEKENPEPQKLVGNEPPKSRSGYVDESVDSLFKAIGKLGGLNKDEVVGTWGIDPADKPNSGVVGKPLWRREGGLSIDGMAEALSQYGYLTLDENGKADLAEFERLFADELAGNPQYSMNVDPSVFAPPQGNTVANPEGLSAARLSLDGLREMGVSTEVINLLKARKMTSKDGYDPAMIAPMFQYDTADQMVQELAAAVPPKEAIAALTDKKMLEQFGNLATPEAIEQAADAAVHNEIRARMVATELAALENSVGPRETVADKNGKQRSIATMPKLAKQYADQLIAKLKIRNVRPGQYAAAETRAAKAAQEALAKNDREQAAVEKRTQLVNLYATKAAHQAQEDVRKGIEYLRRVQKPGKIPPEHHEQIMSLLSKYSLRNDSLGNLDNVKRFRTWAKAQLDAGQIPPNVESLLTPEQRTSFMMEVMARNDDGDLVYPNEEDQALLLAGYIDEMPVRNYKDITVEEFRGLVETVKQIEHIGKRTQKVLTDRKNRLFDALIAEITQNGLAVAERTGRQSKDVRTSNTWIGGVGEMGRGAFFSHVKAAALVEVIDGQQGGPLWEALVLTANEATDAEVMSVAKAHDQVKKLLRDLQKNGDITDRARFFPSIGRELNRQARIAMAMNMGNESNMQRLLGGEGWTMEQIKPVLDTLTAADWQFVQSMWDLYEEYKPQWVKVYRELNGAEPEMVDPRPLEVETADGQKLTLRGGYAPVVFDPRGSGKAASQAAEKQAKQMLQAARVASTVNKSFTKARVEEVHGRPLMLSLDSLINGLQDTIHYTHWQPWVIDANRIVKALDDAWLREKYGAEAVNVLRDWVADTAAGVHGPRDSAEKMIAWAAKNVSFTALAMNVMNAAQQITGVSSSIVTLGAGGSAGSGYVWFARGMSHVFGNSRKAYTEAIEKSDFMKKRATTMLRDLNETANVVQDQGKFGEFSDKYGYILTQMMQVTVDLPTWWGAYYKAVAKQDGISVSSDGTIDDSRAVALADQAVIDAQGSGLKKDLARYERATGAMRLLAGFMSYMNAMFNQNYRIARSEKSVPRKIHDLLLINTIPVIGMVLLKSLLVPGGDDEPEDLAKKMATEQVGFLFGQMIGLREVSQIAAAVSGDQFAGSYGGPVGLRAASDTLRLAQQVGQGEADLPLLKAAITVGGDIFRLPSVQINRTITGINAVADGETEGPVETLAAPVFGFKRQ